MSKKTTRTTKRISVRQALIASIARDVTWLIEHDRFRDLEAVMEATGYMSNRHYSTSRKMGSAIIALSTVIERSWLEGTATAATFHRHYRGRTTAAWYRADARADQTLRDAGVDVDARNAAIALDSERIMEQGARCLQEQSAARAEAVN